MNNREQSIRIKARSERRYLLVVYGVPMLLALITATIFYVPFVQQYIDVIATLNFLIAVVVSVLAGIFQSGIETSVRKRISRGISDGIFGGIVYGMSFFVTMMVFSSIGVSRWMAPN